MIFTKYIIHQSITISNSFHLFYLYLRFFLKEGISASLLVSLCEEKMKVCTHLEASLKTEKCRCSNNNLITMEAAPGTWHQEPPLLPGNRTLTCHGKFPKEGRRVQLSFAGWTGEASTNWPVQPQLCSCIHGEGRLNPFWWGNCLVVGCLLARGREGGTKTKTTQWRLSHNQ